MGKIVWTPPTEQIPAIMAYDGGWKVVWGNGKYNKEAAMSPGAAQNQVRVNGTQGGQEYFPDTAPVGKRSVGYRGR